MSILYKLFQLTSSITNTDELLNSQVIKTASQLIEVTEITACLIILSSTYLINILLAVLSRLFKIWSVLHTM